MIILGFFIFIVFSFALGAFIEGKALQERSLEDHARDSE